MDESPRKQKSTSKVIDDLHSKIDVLKEELENLKVSHSDYKKRNTNLSNKNDSLIDQLANCKHENDMINALLKRKERRIADLEGQFDDVNSETEALRQLVKSYKIRCDNLLDSSASSTAELERLKISYDALMASQVEYKRHYQDQVASLSTKLEAYKQDFTANLNALLQSQSKQEKDQETLVESLTSRNKSLELVYFNKNKAAVSALALLAHVAKLHGEESKSLLHDNVEIINAAREQYPKLAEVLSERTEATIDLDELLKDSDEKLDISFDTAEPPSMEDTGKGGNRQSSNRKKKNRRSVRGTSDLTEEILPKARGTGRDSSRRSPSVDGALNPNRRSSYSRRVSQNQNPPRANGYRASQIYGAPGQANTNSTPNKLFFASSNGWQSQTDHGNSHSKNGNNNNSKNSKRRLFYGGSSHFNSGPERKVSGKLDSGV